ncbi:MAG: hypothetical protein QOK28_3377 [Actinomycetota bacterium]|jgi:hypothetical protein
MPIPRLKNWNWNMVAALAAIAGLVVGTAAVCSRDTGNKCSGSGNARVRCEYRVIAGDAAQRDESELLNDRRKYANVDPHGSGPWPFVVVRDHGIGLKVRTTPLADGEQIGGLSSRHTAWVACQRHTDFDPEPSLETGALWYQLRWPSVTPGTDLRESGYSDKYTGWAFGYYLTPLGQNGDVPDCGAP